MKRFCVRFCAAATVGAIILSQTADVLALPAAPAPETAAQPTQIQYHGGRPGGGHVRPSAHVRPPVHRPPAHIRPPAYRPGHAVRPGFHGGYWGGWRRPHYGWRPGGAIAAGAALGFLGAAAAAAYATSAAPGPGLCWYYTDASRRAGFWDACP